MLIGIVSNCWQVQLAAGAELDELVADASSRGYGAIELRQTCLGSYESANHMPLSNRLSQLQSKVPGPQLNIAMNLPCFAPDFSAEDTMFAAGKAAAIAVAGSKRPHLRLVDLTTVGELVNPIEPDVAGRSIASLATAMVDCDGLLSIENSRQPWVWFYETMQSAWQELGQESDRLRLCYDPCNLLFDETVADPYQVTQDIDVGTLSMVHFKQRRGGQILPAVCDGDIEWKAHLEVLAEKSYKGVALFEIAPHKNVWGFLSGSHEYLRRRGLSEL